MKSDAAPQKSRGIFVVALWMLALPLPGLYRDLQQGLEVVMLPMTTIEWGYYLTGIVCAIGLLRLRPWARVWAIGLFFLHFLWLLAMIYILSGPTLNYVIEGQSVVFKISPELCKVLLASLISVYLLWLFGVIFYLFNPSIKLQFSRKEDPRLGYGLPIVDL